MSYIEIYKQHGATGYIFPGDLPIKGFTKITGSLYAAHVLAYLNHGLEHTSNKQGYFYKSIAEIANDLGFSEFQVKNAIKKLKERGLIDVVVKKAKNVPTSHFKVDSELLRRLCVNDAAGYEKEPIYISQKVEEPQMKVEDTIQDMVDDDEILSAEIIEKTEKCVNGVYKNFGLDGQRYVIAKIEDTPIHTELDAAQIKTLDSLIDRIVLYGQPAIKYIYKKMKMAVTESEIPY